MHVMFMQCICMHMKMFRLIPKMFDAYTCMCSYNMSGWKLSHLRDDVMLCSVVQSTLNSPNLTTCSVIMG